MTSIGEKPTRTEALKYYRRVAEHYKLDIHQYETVLGISGEDGQFNVVTQDRLKIPGNTRHKRLSSPPATTIFRTG